MYHVPKKCDQCTMFDVLLPENSNNEHPLAKGTNPHLWVLVIDI